MSDNRKLEEQLAQLQALVLQQSKDIADLRRALDKSEKSSLDEEFEEDSSVAQAIKEESAGTFEQEDIFLQEEVPLPLALEEEAEPEASIEDANFQRAYENLHGTGAAAQNGEKRDMEKKIGGMMGIVASVMIFISIILFVTMVYSAMNDTLKILCIFLFSGIILAAGVWSMNRNPNFFTMSLTGCGMGAMYLSLFITHVYFGRINQIVLYLLLVVWAVAVYYFFGKKYLAFKITGQAGIVISVIFGLSLVLYAGADAESFGKLLFLMGYFMASSWFYLFADRADSGRGTAVCILLDEIAMLMFFIGFWWVKTVGIGAVPVYAAFMIVNLLMFLWRYVITGENRDSTLRALWYVLLLIFSSVLLFFTIGACISLYGSIIGAIVAIPVMAALLVIEILRKKRDVLHEISVCVIYLLLLLFTVAILADEWVAVVFAAYAALIVWAGYHFEDRTAIVLSYVSGVLAAGIMKPSTVVPGVILCVCAAGLGGILLCREEKMYSSRLKIGFYLTVQLMTGSLVMRILDCLGADEALVYQWGYVFCAGLSIAACQKFFSHSFVDRTVLEQDVSNVTGAVNGILMTIGSWLLLENDNSVMKFVLLVVVAAVYMINVLPSFERFGDTRGVGIYNGLKMSVYVFMVLKSYEFSGPVISIGWLLLAIVLIFAGFQFEFKNLRVYGLGLTMFSLCKLLIFDIDYGSAALRAFSFLISGVLCFVINLIYHKMQKDNEES